MVRVCGLIVAVVWWMGCGIPPPDSVEIPRGPAHTMPVWEPSSQIGWTGWDDAVPPLCRFDALRDWRVATEPTVTVRWESARAPFTGDRLAGRLSTEYRGTIGRVRLVPASPLRIVEPSSTLETIIGSRRTGSTTSAPPRLRLWVRMHNGSSRSLDLGGWPDDRWTIFRTLLPADMRWVRPGECSIEAIEVLDWADASSRELWFGAVAVYAEDSTAVRWPRSDTVTFRVGRRVEGAVVWDPPTPGVPPAPSGVVSQVAVDGDSIVFTVTGSAGRVGFRFRPAAWQQGIEIGWNERWHARWKGILWSGVAETGEVRSIRAHDRGVELLTSAGVQVSIRPHGYSVWIGVRAPAGVVRELRARGFETASERLAVPLPLLSEGPRLQMWRAADAVATPIFATGFWDPFVSRSTRLSFEERDADAPLGRAIYEPAADGRCNSVQEAFVLTVAPDVLAVLPNVPVTTARRAGDAAVAWFDQSPGLAAGPAQLDGPMAGPSFRLVQPTGTVWNSAELDCLDSRWRRAFLRQAPDGSWVQGRSGGLYALKAHAWAQLLPTETEDLAVPNPAVVVGLTERLPWDLVDYDPRVDGAASWSAPWSEISAALRHGAWRPAGIALCFSRCAWWHADSADAAILSSREERGILARSWLPLFAWQRLHRRLPVVGPAVSGSDDAEESHRLATTIAYGFALRVNAPAGRAWRPIYRVAALQRRQALSPLDRIAWNDGRHWLSPSDALVSGAWETGWLYLRFADGLEVWVNGSSNRWAIRVAGEDLELPAWGWRALGKEFSAGFARVDSHLADWVRAPEYLYHDGRGSDQVVEGLGCAVPVVGFSEPADRSGRSRVRLRFPDRVSRVVLSPPLWPAGATLVRAVATDRDGRPWQAPAVARQGNALIVGPAPGTYEVRLEWTR